MPSFISQRIEAAAPGTVFITSDLADVATVSAINMALSRMAAGGELRRIMRGVYEKPRYSKLLGEPLAPDIKQVADAIARNYGWTITPAGETAMNLLGLSTQVPAAWEFVSDGPYKEYECGGVKMRFKHTANKLTSGRSRLTSTVIQAIKAYGKEIDEAAISTLRTRLSSDDRKTILHEARGTTAWIYEVIKVICGGDEQ